MADLEEQISLISHFCAVAGVDQDRARFYLELEKWILDLALARFFDNSDMHAEVSDTLPQAAIPTTSQSTFPTRPAGASHFASRTNQPSRITTFGSLKQDSDSSDEEGQAYYAGGSERGGGQQIIGPPKKKSSDARSLVSDMFQSAKEHGAEVVDDESGAVGSRQHSTFAGRAYRLGDNAVQSEVIEGQNREAANQHVKVVLKLWQNGFSINDGPLRDFNDPANQKFMEEINRGQVPRELLNEVRGGEVHLTMEDHHHEDYVKPPTVIQPFGGQGHRLGCPLDPVSEANSSARVMAGTTSALSGASGLSHDVAATLNVDQSQPITNLQIRLADGARLTSTFNHSHRVADIRQFIITARPDYASTRFVLMTTFPNAELGDEMLTLSEAKLLNSVIVQRVK